MDDEAPNAEAAALREIHKQLKSWPKVAKFLEQHSSEPVSDALAWKVANGKCDSERITLALLRAGLIDQPAPTVAVEICTDCGQLHTWHKTCPTERRPDSRRRRAWAGPPERATLVDEMVRERGYDSLSRMIDSLVDEYESEGR